MRALLRLLPLLPFAVAPACDQPVDPGTRLALATQAPISGTGSVTDPLAIAYGGVSNAMLAHSTITLSPGPGLSGGGAVALGHTATLGLAGPVSAINGGTGLNGPTAPGQFLRSPAAGVWQAGPIQPSDLPAMAGLLVDLQSPQVVNGLKVFTSLIEASISGNAGSVTNGLYSTESYVDPPWLMSLAGDKVVGKVSAARAADSAVAFSGRLAGDVNGTQGATAVSALAGVPLSATPPTDGQVLQYSAATGRWGPVTPGAAAGMAGDGSDGPLIVRAGTTLLNVRGKNVYQFSSVSITDAGVLAIGPSLQNTPVFVLVQGDLTVTSGAQPAAVTARAMGGPGGAASGTSACPASTGCAGGAGATAHLPNAGGAGGGGGGGYGEPGGPGASGGAANAFSPGLPISRLISDAFLGGGGGSGEGSGGASGGAGGAGGGCLIFLVGGSVNLTGTLSAEGADGASASGSAQGGGGGGGGFLGVFHAGPVVANSATFLTGGGKAGRGSDARGPAGAGGSGQSLVRRMASAPWGL